MSSVPMPRDLSEEAVAEWMVDVYYGPGAISPGTVKAWGALEMQRSLARAVRALLREKVREAVERTMLGVSVPHKGHLIWDHNVDGFVSRVLGDHPAGGQSAEGRKEAPRG